MPNWQTHGRCVAVDPRDISQRPIPGAAGSAAGGREVMTLCSLQRELDLSVVLVHHTRKNAGAREAAGQGLRGSSDIHAFGDSNLYLRRTKDQLLLISEHRAAAAAPPVSLQLVAGDGQTHLEVIAAVANPQRPSLPDQVLDLLAPGVSLTRAKLRHALRVNNERLGEALESLEQAKRVYRTPAGWQRHHGLPEGSVPVPTL